MIHEAPSWRCKCCKHDNNPDEQEFCDKCFAPRRGGSLPRETCRTCLHRHSAGRPCCVYVVHEKSRKRKAQKWSKPGRSDEESPSSASGSPASKASSASGKQGIDTDSEEDDGEGDSEKYGGEKASSDESLDTDSSKEQPGRDDRGKQKKQSLRLRNRLAAKAVAVAKQAGQAVQSIVGRDRNKKLETPPWAKASCLRRCNCGQGVPTDNTAFVPLEACRSVRHDAVGSVTIRDDPLVGDELKFENRLTPAAVPPPPNWGVSADLRPLVNAGRHDHCLRARGVARRPERIVAILRHRECYAQDDAGKPLHPAYVGVHSMELESSLVAGEDRIDGLFFHQPPQGGGGHLFISSQRSVSVWRRLESPVVAHTPVSQGEARASSDSATDIKETTEHGLDAYWEMAGVAVRDTAPFTTIRPVNNSIICCSSNGSIREWSMAHDVNNTRCLAQMCEHSDYITDVESEPYLDIGTSTEAIMFETFAAPSVGHCKSHGAPVHSCLMYSVSDDRTLKVWDMFSKKCLHTVKPYVSDCGTLQSVATSDFYLYAGTSHGEVIAFALERVCLRTERHRCHLYDEPRWFCEQEAFGHGMEPVQHMVSGGLEGKHTFLFTAVNTTIKAWKVPKTGFGHEEAKSLRQHKQAITALAVTHVHLFSGSDDGNVGIWSLGSLELQRVVGQERRIKCIWVHHAPPESSDAGKGFLFLGLATGIVLTYPISDAV